MFRLILPFLTASAAALAEDKVFPEWPRAFSATFRVSGPRNSPEGAAEPYDVYYWFDDEDGNLKRQIGSSVWYVLEKYEGRGVFVQVDISGSCTLRYAGPLALEAESPLPKPPSNPQFLEDTNLDGVSVEKWRFDREGETTEEFVIVYLKRQEGVGVPVRLESFEDRPPDGSDLILPFVVEVTAFSTSKPPVDVFHIDTNNCKEVPSVLEE